MILKYQVKRIKIFQRSQEMFTRTVDFQLSLLATPGLEFKASVGSFGDESMTSSLT